jgi:hypothetical protein
VCTVVVGVAQVLGVRLCCVPYDVKGLCVTYYTSKMMLDLAVIFFVQLVVCNGFSMDIEVFYYV